MTTPWIPTTQGAPIPWTRLEAVLVRTQAWEDPHKVSRRLPESRRRAAVALLCWGDAQGAREVILVQRGETAPQHPGEIALPGGMVEPGDRDLRWTARRELAEEIGVTEHLWEVGCFPDGVAKARTRFTPVIFRWEAPEPRFCLRDGELQRVIRLPLEPLFTAPWTTEILDRQGLALEVPRLELPEAPLWGATAYVLKAWLDELARA